MRRRRLAPTQLWLHALSEATDDAEIRRHFRRHLREVHDYVAGVLRRAQAAGGIEADRDVDAEAWIGLGIGLLRSVQDRFGGLLGEDDIDGDRLLARSLADGGEELQQLEVYRPLDARNPRLRLPGVRRPCSPPAQRPPRNPTLRLGRRFGLSRGFCDAPLDGSAVLLQGWHDHNGHGPKLSSSQVKYSALQLLHR